MSCSRHANEVRTAIVVTTPGFLGQIRKGITSDDLCGIEQAKLPETFRDAPEEVLAAHLRDMVDVVGHEFDDEHRTGSQKFAHSRQGPEFRAFNIYDHVRWPEIREQEISRLAPYLNDLGRIVEILEILTRGQGLASPSVVRVFDELHGPRGIRNGAMNELDVAAGVQEHVHLQGEKCIRIGFDSGNSRHFFSYGNDQRADMAPDESYPRRGIDHAENLLDVGAVVFSVNSQFSADNAVRNRNEEFAVVGVRKHVRNVSTHELAAYSGTP